VKMNALLVMLMSWTKILAFKLIRMEIRISVNILIELCNRSYLG
jgi:hypothetical protein